MPYYPPTQRTKKYLRLYYSQHIVPPHQERPYHADRTTSRPLCEVKRRRARLVLRWGTTWEALVLFLFRSARLIPSLSSTPSCLSSTLAGERKTAHPLLLFLQPRSTHGLLTLSLSLRRPDPHRLGLPRPDKDQRKPYLVVRKTTPRRAAARPS